MNLLEVDVVTAERRVYTGEASAVVAPSASGQVTILPRHAALLTALQAGEVRLMRAGQEDLELAVGGGFLEVRDDKVCVVHVQVNRRLRQEEAGQAAAHKERHEAQREHHRSVELNLPAPQRSQPVERFDG